MSFVYNPDIFNDNPTTIEYSIVVKYNTFHFRVKLSHHTISVGGKNPQYNCVQITINNREIAWVKGSIEGNCELNGKPISGDSTIAMVHIGLWFLKNGYLDITYPPINELVLTDSSKIYCTLPDGSIRSMSLMHRDLLIHGQSFYQRKLGAEPYTEIGMQDVINFQKSRKSTKAKFFDFKNIYLNNQLTKYYNDTSTWEDFMNVLVKEYGNKQICQVMYPWYNEAVSEITGGRGLPTRWVIRNIQPKITPEIVGNFTGGFHTEIDSPSFHEGWNIYTMKFQKTRKLRKSRKRKSRT
jgi:hypothetical protein